MNRKKMLLLIPVVLLVAFIALNLFVHYYGDWLWFQNLGFDQVFTKILWAKFLAFASFFLTFTIFGGVNILIAKKWGASSRALRTADFQSPDTYLDIIFNKKMLPVYGL